MLNMRSVPPEDQTAAARIRDEAIDLFGRHGFRATTIRQIAAQAGVSQALVMHHYGGKEALRQACDTFVVDALFSQQADAAQLDLSTMDRLVREALPESPPMRYLARLLTEPGHIGDGLWDRMAEGTRIVLDGGPTGVAARPDPDRDAQTQVMLAVSLSLIVFARHIARGMGAEKLDAQLLMRAHASLMRMLTLGAFDLDDETQRSYDDYVAHVARTTPSQGEKKAQ